VVGSGCITRSCSSCATHVRISMGTQDIKRARPWPHGLTECDKGAWGFSLFPFPTRVSAGAAAAHMCARSPGVLLRNLVPRPQVKSAASTAGQRGSVRGGCCRRFCGVHTTPPPTASRRGFCLLLAQYYVPHVCNELYFFPDALEQKKKGHCKKCFCFFTFVLLILVPFYGFQMRDERVPRQIILCIILRRAKE
jgi:hypothetical protein